MILQLLADCGGQIQLGPGLPTAQAKVGGLPAQHLKELIRLQLSLSYWIIATERERARLVHHELGHCALDGGKPVSAPHHIEGALLGRFLKSSSAPFF